MDADQAATVFVEVCTRLDALVDAQRETNELLGAVESALTKCLELLTDDRGDSLTVPHTQRGLGHLMPYGDNGVHSTAAGAS